MQRPGYSLPTAAEFTDYSKWERKPSSKSETSGGWSIGRVRGEVTGSKRLQGRRQDALSHAAGLSQDSVLVTCAPDNVQKLHSRCHGSSTSKKLSSLYSPPRSVKRSKGSPDGKITKAQAVLPPKLALLQVSSLADNMYGNYVYTSYMYTENHNFLGCKEPLLTSHPMCFMCIGRL